MNQKAAEFWKKAIEDLVVNSSVILVRCKELDEYRPDIEEVVIEKVEIIGGDDNCALSFFVRGSGLYSYNQDFFLDLHKRTIYANCFPMGGQTIRIGIKIMGDKNTAKESQKWTEVDESQMRLL